MRTSNCKFGDQYLQSREVNLRFLTVSQRWPVRITFQTRTGFPQFLRSTCGITSAPDSGTECGTVYSPSQYAVALPSSSGTTELPRAGGGSPHYGMAPEQSTQPGPTEAAKLVRPCFHPEAHPVTTTISVNREDITL